MKAHPNFWLVLISTAALSTGMQDPVRSSLDVKCTISNRGPSQNFMRLLTGQEESGEKKSKQDSKPSSGKTYGEFQGKYFDVFASTQENADILGKFFDETVGAKFERFFGKPSSRCGIFCIGNGGWQNQEMSDEEKKTCLKYGAEWCWRAPEEDLIKLIKDWDKMADKGAQAHFSAGTFLHYFGPTMLSTHIYRIPPKEKRKDERVRLEKRWGNKYLMPFWFSLCWTNYSEPANQQKDRWNSLSKRFKDDFHLNMKQYFSDGYKDWTILYSVSLPVMEYLVELGGPEFIHHMLDCFIAEKDMSVALKWLEENRDKLKLTDPPSTIKKLEEGFHEWAKKKLPEKLGKKGKDDEKKDE